MTGDPTLSDDIIIDLIHATRTPNLDTHTITLLRNAATTIAALRSQHTTHTNDIPTLLRERSCPAGLPWTGNHPEEDHGHTDCWLHHAAANEIERLRNLTLHTHNHDATWHPHTPVDNPANNNIHNPANTPANTPMNNHTPVDNPDPHRDFLSNQP